MASHSFGAFINVESAPSNTETPTIPTPPQKAVARTYHSVALPRESTELDNTSILNRPLFPNTTTPSASGSQTPMGSNDLEMSRPPSPYNEHDGVDVMQSFSNPPMNRFRMVSVCSMNFGNGLSDSAPGALLPYVERYYGIGYAVVSLVFVANALGFIAAAFFVDVLRERLGRAKTLITSMSLMSCAYVIISCTPPFPVVVLAFFLLGFGMAINLALSNVFAANLVNGTRMLGCMHGSYGIGGTVGPLMATGMVASGGLPWSRFYLIPLSVAIFNLFFAGWSFWKYEAEGQSLLTPMERIISRTQNNAPKPEAKPIRQLANMVKAFKSKTVILGALFIFAYQGAEVSISGWVISFLITSREGNPASVGYVTSGFWGGITLGRFLLVHPAHKIGEKISVYGLVVGAAIFELLVWQVPNVIGDAVAVSIVGLLLGPVYPCATTIFSKAIGRKEQVNSLSVISAFGSSGGAVAPFTTGILAQAAGTFVLHPIAIGLFAVMLGCWYVLPNVRKRTE